MADESKRHAEIMKKIAKEDVLGKADIMLGVCANFQNQTSGGFPESANPNLHHLSQSNDPDELNPYQRSIVAIGKGFVGLDEDGAVNAYVSGTESTGSTVETLHREHKTCKNFDSVLKQYNNFAAELAAEEEKLGPTVSFGPFVEKAIEWLTNPPNGKRKKYIILVIITDGNIDEVKSKEAIIKASHYQISIIIVGVGKGSKAHGWKHMVAFDSKLPTQGFFSHSEKKSKFDNVNFVEFHKSLQEARKHNPAYPDLDFAAICLEEIPKQYHYIRKEILKE